MYIHLLSGLLLIGIAPAAFAEEMATFSDYAEKLTAHPQRLELLEQARQERFEAEGELGLPDPVLGIGVNNLPVNSGSFHQERMTGKTIGISQNIPNPSLRKAKAAQGHVMAARTAIRTEYTTQKLKALFVVTVARQQKKRRADKIGGKAA